jgi:hypothetical protein
MLDVTGVRDSSPYVLFNLQVVFGFRTRFVHAGSHKLMIRGALFGLTPNTSNLLVATTTLELPPVIASQRQRLWIEWAGRGLDPFGFKTVHYSGLQLKKLSSCTPPGTSNKRSTMPFCCSHFLSALAVPALFQHDMVRQHKLS